MSFFRYNFFLAVLTMVCAALSVSGAVWLFLEIQRDRATLASLAFAYEDAVKKSAYASTVRALLRDTEAERSELDALVKDRDPVSIIRTLEDVGAAAKVHVTVQAVSSGGPLSADATLSSFMISMSADGSFDKLHHFVTLLSALPIPSQVEQVKFERHERDWQASVVVRIFVEQTQQI